MMDKDSNQHKSSSSTEENPTTSADHTKTAAVIKKRRGILSSIWNRFFRPGNEDFEKKLRRLSMEEASILARMKRRAQRWRNLARNLVVSSVILEVVAVAYAIMVTRSINLNWKMRAVRVLPMFVLPALSSAIYLTLVSLTRMRNHKDQKALERLCAERQAGVDELKEKTNYYMTQQLIQKYDPDPAAKAAAARVLASKLGTESGLKVHLEDESNFTVPHGKSNDAELVQSRGLQNRKQSLSKHGSTRNSEMQQLVKEMSSNDGHDENPKLSTDDQAVIVENHPRSVVNEGGWFARIAALLVGEDPTQCYALVCGNCHTHNGLARKEDFPFITYYCPHCHALNKSREVEDHGPISPAGDPRSNARGEEVNETR